MTPDEVMVFLEVAIVVLLLVEVIFGTIGLCIQIDDVYGWTQLKKNAARNWRRSWRRFIRTKKKRLK